MLTYICQVSASALVVSSIREGKNLPWPLTFPLSLAGGKGRKVLDFLKAKGPETCTGSPEGEDQITAEGSKKMG